MKIRITKVPLKKYQMLGEKKEETVYDEYGNIIPVEPAKFNVTNYANLPATSNFSAATNTSLKDPSMQDLTSSYFNNVGIQKSLRKPYPSSWTLTEKDGILDSSEGYISKSDTDAFAKYDWTKAKEDPLFTEKYNALQNYINTGSKKEIRQGVKDMNKTFPGMKLKGPGLFAMGATGRKVVGNLANTFNDIGTGIKVGSILGSAITDMADTRRKEKDFSSWMRNQMNSDALYKSVAGSRGDYMPTGSRFGEFRPDQYVTNRGMFAEYGGENLDNMKIRITGMPSMAYGGQSNYGLDLSRNKVYSDMPEDKSEDVSNSIFAVPRHLANIEAEGGETVYGDLDSDGMMEHMKIQGKRHSEGGVPLNVPEGSFIFSDTKKMKIKDPEILKKFGMSSKKGGYTPATIAKKFPINEYKAKLQDPNADIYEKNAANLKWINGGQKLGLLSMIQEGMKRYPQGIPKVAQAAMQIGQVAYGGYIDLPKAQFGNLANTVTSATSSLPVTKKNTVVVANKDPKKPAITIKEEDIFNPQIVDDLKKKGYDIKYSPRIAKGDVKVPIMQAKQKSGVYGDIQMSEIAEFKARHPWYFASRPNWDPTNPNDVFDFQTRYDEEFAKQKGFSYFDGLRPFSKKDGLYGEYTYNAPGLDMSKAPEKTPPVVDKQTPKKEPLEEYPPNVLNAENSSLPFGYMTPDLVNMAAAAMVPPKKYMPYRAPVSLPKVSPTFYDPNRAIAAQNEAANMLAQNAALFANPQSYMANAARIKGILAEGVADIMADTQNKNVGVANQFAGINADIIGKENMLSAQRINDLYDASILAQQNLDNSRRLYNRNLAASYAQAWNNRMNLGMLNAVNPIYRVNPRIGLSYFVRGYDPYMLGRNAGSSTGTGAGINSFRDLKNKFLQDGYSESLAERKADQILSGGRGTISYIDNDVDGWPDRAFYSLGAQNLIPYYTAMQRFLPRPSGME